MLNFAFASIDLVAKRQQGMLRPLGQNLLGIDAKAACDAGAMAASNKYEREALLTAGVLQGIFVAQTLDGVLEPHVKSASWLMQALGYFKMIP
ncbi:Zn(2)-C6 fungal-type DNA-binding domain [Penicillium digitatum]|uniref:Uncharacterized protein n=3 Tax=Penicillium digitatum TaxID=36651 RepID=K9FU67_PEND2|nr:hypothetical protein PDIP_25000 [Penicillium digitatum Pd1]EKV13170.1 hypothetical protein PDIG_39450 [Penicillium digitatum PHI26]EKV18956.1 hypothetical protein PDIP_25000 [Penicillium digitatum Pd1]QQK42901.1 Zn(2)-C6 fungal-type DNA-binding domain [Penicillium digitatum]